MHVRTLLHAIVSWRCTLTTSNMSGNAWRAAQLQKWCLLQENDASFLTESMRAILVHKPDDGHHLVGVSVPALQVMMQSALAEWSREQGQVCPDLAVSRLEHAMAQRSTPMDDVVAHVLCD